MPIHIDPITGRPPIKPTRHQRPDLKLSPDPSSGLCTMDGVLAARVVGGGSQVWETAVAADGARPAARELIDLMRSTAELHAVASVITDDDEGLTVHAGAHTIRVWAHQDWAITLILPMGHPQLKSLNRTVRRAFRQLRA